MYVQADIFVLLHEIKTAFQAHPDELHLQKEREREGVLDLLDVTKDHSVVFASKS